MFIEYKRMLRRGLSWEFCFVCVDRLIVLGEGGEYTWNDSHGDADYEHGDDYFDDYADDVDDDGDDDGDVDW